MPKIHQQSRPLRIIARVTNILPDMRSVLFAFFLSILCACLTAQSGAWTVFTPPPDVNSLAARGNVLLAGTNGAGIVRFDTLGNRTHVNTENSGLPSDSIRQLAIDAEGYWWMQYPGSISRFDGANAQTWTLTQTGLPANAAVRALKAAPDSSLYMATDNGVAIFKAGAWTVLNTANSGLPTNNIHDAAFGPDGKRYFATTGRGIVVQDGANWTSYTSATTGVSLMDNVFSVAITTEGVLWAVGGNGPTTALRLVKFEAGAWTGFTSASIGISTPAPPVRKVVAGSAGRLILTTTKTISILQQGNWTHQYAEDIGCSPDAAVAALEDGAGRVWAQTLCQLARFDGQTWIKPGAGLPGPSNGLMWDGITEGVDGSIWIGSEWVGSSLGGYIARLKDGVWEQYYPADFGASESSVFSAHAAPNGTVWFGLGNSEILRYANGDWTFFDTCAVPFPDHFVLTTATAPNGDQWFSLSPNNLGAMAGAGLARFSADGQWTFFTQANSPLPPNSYIRKILFDTDGNAWFSTLFHGAYRYNGVIWENFSLPNNTAFEYLALAPDGAVWAAVSGSGVARFDGQGWVFPADVNSGLPSTLTFRIVFDRAGGMYVGYSPGTPGAPGARVAVLRGGVWTELIPPNWTNSSQDAPDVFFMDSQNRLWFAKSVDFMGLVYRYDPMLVRTEEPVAGRPLFSVSPNPTSGLLTLRLEAPLRADARLHVWNTFGQMVYQRLIPQTPETAVPADLSALPAGVYWLRLGEDGGAEATVRVVKQ